MVSKKKVVSVEKIREKDLIETIALTIKEQVKEYEQCMVVILHTGNKDVVPIVEAIERKYETQFERMGSYAEVVHINSPVRGVLKRVQEEIDGFGIDTEQSTIKRLLFMIGYPYSNSVKNVLKLGSSFFNYTLLLTTSNEIIYSSKDNFCIYKPMCQFDESEDSLCYTVELAYLISCIDYAI